MRIDLPRLGITITTGQKAAGMDLVTNIPASRGGWWPVLREGFAGAWQRSIVTPIEDALTHPTYWACVTLIAGDVAKIRPMLVETVGGIDVEVARQSPYAPVLVRPNHYNNRIQFFTYWMLSKLTRGAAFALKARDARGIVTDLYLLDPMRVRPMISPGGQVYYACQQDLLAELTDASIVVPAREIIHDIGFAPYHPLCGVSPVYACGAAAMQGLTIIGNSTRLFRNGSLIGGVLTAPGTISVETAKRLEEYWNANYAGERNIGKVAVLGDGLKFEKPSVMTAVDSEVIKSLNWGDEKIAAVHHVPRYKVEVGPLPSYNNVEALSQDYFGTCLQYYFESLELCLTEGLELEDVGYKVEFDIDALDRMDSAQKMDVATKGIVGGLFAPNEGRAKFNLKPVKGGDTPYLQIQNYSLAALDKRDSGAFAAPITPGLPAPKPTDGTPADPNAPTPTLTADPEPPPTKGLETDPELLEHASGAWLRKELAA